MRRKICILLLIPFLIWTGCTYSSGTKQPNTKVAYHPDQQFNDHWYNNIAELSHYKLTQARYGEMREGNAVLIFVTEHLDPETHVKTANEDNKGIPVIKLNATRNFTTGIYPYSLMTSVFTPVNVEQNPNTLKVAFTGQEWCGHVFEMLNLVGDKYNYILHSYFEGEADQEFTVDLVFLEDEIMNRIRIAPASLPTGEVEMVPSLLYVRLMHKEMKSYTAQTALIDSADNSKYIIKYPDLERQVIIWFEKQFPHKILKWEEAYDSGFGSDKKKMTTTAILDTTIYLDYWNKNSEADTIHRKALGM